MKQSKINNLSAAELQSKLSELKKIYADLKSAHAISPIENPLQLRNVRRSIARVNTALGNKDLQ